MFRDAELRQLTSCQHGLATRLQLVELGVSSGALAHAITSGRLEELSERVLRLGGSADTSDQRLMAAALDIPGGAVAITTAATLCLVQGFELEPIHVLTDRTPNRGVPRLGIVHTTTRFEAADVMRVRGIPVTSPLRTLRDLAGRIHPERLDLVCERMLSKRLFRVEDLHALVATLPRRGGARGTAALRALAAARGPGYRPVESNLELRFEAILREAGETPFDRQADVGDEDGWIGRVDFIDRSRRVIVEVQSDLFHAGRVDRARDDIRLSRLRRAGWTVLEIGEFDIWHRPDRVLAAVREARHPRKGGSPHPARNA